MHLLLALIAGALMPLSYAPFGFWPLVFPALAILYWLIRQATPRRALLLGLLFSLPYFGFGVAWIYNSVHDFGAAIPPVAVAVTVMFVLVVIVFPVTACALSARFRSGRPIVDSAAFASFWTLAELLRGWVMGGFPWLLLGYTQTDSVFRAFKLLLKCKKILVGFQVRVRFNNNHELLQS